MEIFLHCRLIGKILCNVRCLAATLLHDGAATTRHDRIVLLFPIVMQVAYQSYLRFAHFMEGCIQRGKALYR